MKKKKRPNTMDQFRDGSYTDRERYAERENKIGGDSHAAGCQCFA